MFQVGCQCYCVLNSFPAPGYPANIFLTAGVHGKVSCILYTVMPSINDVIILIRVIFFNKYRRPETCQLYWCKTCGDFINFL
jgi:hypothetical protein